VERPAVATAFRRDLEAEGGVGHDIDPGRRRRRVLVEDRYVLAPILGEAADAVEELERRSLGRGVRRSPPLRRTGRRRLDGLRFRAARELLGEAAAARDQ